MGWQTIAHRGLVKPDDVAGYYRALRACVGARILNLSVGGEEEDEIENEIIELALRTDTTIVVAASGNHREYGDPPIYPAALSGVIAWRRWISMEVCPRPVAADPM